MPAPRVEKKVVNYGLLFGKLARSYTLVQLEILCQMLSISYQQHDTKDGLIRKLLKFEKENPHLMGSQERIKMLRQPFQNPWRRYQAIKEDGKLHITSFPSDTPAMISEAVEKAVDNVMFGLADKLDGTSPRKCAEHGKLVSEIGFPDPIGECCDQRSDVCAECIEKSLRAQIEKGAKGLVLECPACGTEMWEGDLKRLVTKGTLEKYQSLRGGSKPRLSGYGCPLKNHSQSH